MFRNLKNSRLIAASYLSCHLRIIEVGTEFTTEELQYIYYSVKDMHSGFKKYLKENYNKMCIDEIQETAGIIVTYADLLKKIKRIDKKHQRIFKRRVI